MNRTGPTKMVPRLRLLRVLARDWKTAVLSAPAGYGKTVLAGQFIANRDALVCRLRTDDARPVHLLGTILAAAAALKPPIGIRTLDLLAVHRDFERDGGLLTASLVQDLVPAGAVRWIVMDDLHTVSHAPETLAWIRHLMEETGPRVRFLLLCRAECPIPLARFDLMGGSIVLGAADLAFDAAETSLFLRRRRTRLAGSLADAPWAERLAGWPAGLALLARALAGPDGKAHPRRVSARADAEPSKVLDYLVQEAVSPLPQQLQRALCRASVIEDLERDPLQWLLGRRDADWMLAEVRRQDLFLDAGAGPSPRFQPLFRNALRRELRRTAGVDEERRLLERIAEGWESVGRPWKAIDAYLEAGRAARAASLFEKAVQGPSPAAEHPRIAQRILGELRSKSDPASIRYPRLLTQAAHEMQMERRFEDAISCLRAARSRFLQKRRPIDAAEVFRNEGILSTMIGTASESVREARKILRSLPADESAARGLVLLELGQIELHLGKPDSARRCLRAARPLLAGAGRDREIAQATERQAEVNFTRGQWDRYLAETTPVLRYYQRAGFTTRAQSLLINRAEALIYLGREREAMALLDEAALLVARSSAPALRAHEAISRARAASDLGLDAEAVPLFRAAHEAVDRYGSPFSKLQLELWEAVHDRRRGKLQSASRKIESARRGFGQAGSPAWETIARMELGLLRGMRGETDRAIEDLHESILVTRRHGDRKEEAANLLYRAAALRQAGRPFLRPLLASLRILDRESYFVFLRKESRLSIPILSDALRRSPRNPLLRRAAAALPDDRKPQATDAHGRAAAGRRGRGDASHPPLSLRLLGGFELLAGSERLLFPRRACELLIAHLCLRGAPVSREVLAEALWPGAPADASRNRFDVTLSTIRRTLEPEAGSRGPFRFLLSEAGHCRFARGAISLDVDRFESAAASCEPHRKRIRATPLSCAGGGAPSGAEERAMRDLKAALGLNAGDLLAGRDLDPWLAAARERLEERRRDLLLAWGHYARLAGRAQEAIAAAGAVLAVDPLSESAVQLLLLAHIGEGRADAALTAYRRFSRRMTRELGAPPSPETQAIVQPLVARRQAWAPRAAL